ncbi:aspartokinase [Blyttiomyces helicus]|uniref:Aspartokinase n=1 Tax=Blyttiomyces helicus TaxID=388810 RepID=A0A4V1IRZ9_9FUNG|nr:aspartokinase [Blyttiomyces helicus]|eukprot:RKO91817.1 aspartokinase [Blyttiomyces helicus]
MAKPTPPSPLSSPHAIVCKFGGTSIGTAARMLQVADIVQTAISNGGPVVVVLSAMSSNIKAEGTTSRLLEAADDVMNPESTRYLDIVDGICASHLRAVDEALPVEAVEERARVGKEVRDECDRLKGFLSAAQVINEMSPRSRDNVIGTGEKLSALVFTSVLRSRSLNPTYVNLEKLIQKQFDAGTIDQSFYDYLSSRLSTLIGPLLPHSVPVVTGYLGPVPGSLLTTIGRGYTDLTAALIAVGTGADELQIWKEVDGIFTADPRKVPLARMVPFITPEEAAELTYYGSEVIHPFTMEQVIRAAIPIRIKNAFRPEGAGTVIVPEGWQPPQHAEVLETLTPKGTRIPKPGHAQQQHPPTPAAEEEGDDDTPRPTAVTIKDHITVLNVHSNRKSVSHGFFAHIFLSLDRHGIVVDLISTSEVHVSMALSPNVNEGNLEKALVELRKYGTVDVIRNMSILSLVGKKLRNMVGSAGLMFATLGRHGVNIEMISQGASEINISCVIEEEKASEALVAVHDELIVGIMPL